jgi:hypothetical protein
MRRLALIFGMLLTLTTGVWSGAHAAASAWCVHEASAPSAPDEHDCCRAKTGESNAGHGASQRASHDASHESSNTRRENSNAREQARAPRAGMNCASAGEASGARENGAAALVRQGLSCAECCAGGSGQTPAAAASVAPEQNKVRRAAGSNSTAARHLFASAPSHVSHLAPTQHAPPAPLERRHILNGVFLI